MSDFSLMDAIECGIVKLPRVPVAENIPGDEMPMFRNLWENIRKDMPKKGRGQGEELDPLKLPTRLQTALEALYGHYEKTFKLWEEKGIKVPPCFIIVCQNTAISKLVYDFISGFHRKNDDGTTTLENGRLALFRNFDETTGNPLPRPNTLLIDSEQLEAGDALDDNFRGMAADEIERFRREIVERTGDARAGDNITDQELLREVMNTVGKPGQLGGAIRCVVSVSMLTEGWDANTVTHVLGIRAFGTQLLCEQVIGRALRRQSYDLNEEGPTKALQRGICRCLRHSLRLHGEAGHCPAAAAARDGSGQGHAPRARRPRNPLPPRRRLSRGVAGGTADRRLQRRLHPGTQPRPRRPIHHAQLRASSAKAWT